MAMNSFRMAAMMSALVVAGGSVCLADAASDAKARFDAEYSVAYRGVKGTRSSADDAKLAIVLVDAARKSSGDTEYTVLLLENAYELGKLHTDGMRAAADALQELASLIPRRQLEMQEKLLVLYEIVFRNAAGKSDKEIHKRAGTATTDLILEIAEAKAKRAEYASAVAQLRKATGIARSVAYTERIDDIKQMMDEVTPLAPIDLRVQAAKRALAKNPADKNAATTIAELYLKDLDRPLTARTYAEITEDEKKIELYTLAGQPVSTLNAEEARRLAAWYQGMADERGTDLAKTNMLIRAKVYNQRVLDQAADDAAAKSAMAKADLTLAAMDVDAEEVASLVKSRRDRLGIVAAKPKPKPKPIEPPKPVEPPKPADPPKVNPRPADPPKPADPPPPQVIEPDPQEVEPEYREEELDDEYWRKRKSIFDFGM